MHDDFASGAKPIAFRKHRVELAERIALRMPEQTMLCTLSVRAVTADGATVARNYVQFFADAGHPPHEQIDGRIVLRAEPHAWSAAEWSGGFSSRAEAETSGICWGDGHGFFEWTLPVPDEALQRCSRIRVLCEASAHREGTPQTDPFTHPTVLRLELNGAGIYHRVLPNHPHDTRGALSYLRGARGAYGYLASATIEGALLGEVLANSENGTLLLRCAVPEDVTATRCRSR